MWDLGYFGNGLPGAARALVTPEENRSILEWL